MLDVLLKIRDEQDPALFVRVGCRQGRCGACACNIGGRNLLACQTHVDRDADAVGGSAGQVAFEWEA